MATTMSKRKRESHDAPVARPAPNLAASNAPFDDDYLDTGDDSLDNTDGAVMDFAAALAQQSAESGEADADADNHGAPRNPGAPDNADTATAAMAYHTMTVPQSTEAAFMQSAEGGNKHQGDASGSADAERRLFGDPNADVEGGINEDAPPVGEQRTAAAVEKFPVGSDDWHRQRKNLHKEVERRRRETINEGILELAQIVPGCEKNKGSILSRTVQFITQLKDNETANIHKWTLEKTLTEQAIVELSSSCDKLKAECQRAWAECEQWKKAAQKAGASIDVSAAGALKTDRNGEEAD